MRQADCFRCCARGLGRFLRCIVGVFWGKEVERCARVAKGGDDARRGFVENIDVGRVFGRLERHPKVAEGKVHNNERVVDKKEGKRGNHGCRSVSGAPEKDKSKAYEQ